jgi:hypothetical protein
MNKLALYLNMFLSLRFLILTYIELNGHAHHMDIAICYFSLHLFVNIDNYHIYLINSNEKNV